MQKCRFSSKAELSPRLRFPEHGYPLPMKIRGLALRSAASVCVLAPALLLCSYATASPPGRAASVLEGHIERQPNSSVTARITNDGRELTVRFTNVRVFCGREAGGADFQPIQIRVRRDGTFERHQYYEIGGGTTPPIEVFNWIKGRVAPDGRSVSGFLLSFWIPTGSPDQGNVTACLSRGKRHWTAR